MGVSTSCILFMVSLNNFSFCENSFKTLVYMLGGSELEEIELPHLDGHKKSRPVRIGNGAATHIQLVRVSSCCSRCFWFGYN